MGLPRESDMCRHIIGQNFQGVTNEEALARIAELGKELAGTLMVSKDLAKYMFELPGAAYNSDRMDGYAKGKAFALVGKPDNDFKLFKEDCVGHYRNKHKEFGLLEFGVLKAIEKLSQKGVVVDVLRSVLEGGDMGAGATTGGDVGTDGHYNQ
ncbi:hypothetical protein Hanom_Chr14g01273081 [Helianthus anomalus]